MSPLLLLIPPPPGPPPPIPPSHPSSSQHPLMAQNFITLRRDPTTSSYCDHPHPLRISLSELELKIAFFLLTHVLVVPPRQHIHFPKHAILLILRLPNRTPHPKNQILRHSQPVTARSIFDKDPASRPRTILPDGQKATRLPTHLVEQIAGCWAVGDPSPTYRSPIRWLWHPAFAAEAERRCKHWRDEISNSPGEWVSLAREVVRCWRGVWEPPEGGWADWRVHVLVISGIEGAEERFWEIRRRGAGFEMGRRRFVWVEVEEEGEEEEMEGFWLRGGSWIEGGGGVEVNLARKRKRGVVDLTEVKREVDLSGRGSQGG